MTDKKDPSFDQHLAPDPAPPQVTGLTRTVIISLQTAIWWLSSHWLLLANVITGAILAWGILAPIFLAADMPEAAQTVYDWLAPHNHQLPQRSYFLFGQLGPLRTYSVEQLIAAGADPTNLQFFVGDEALGFKMALNQRMTAIFVALFLGGILWGLMKGRPKVGPVWFVLLLLPLLIDGFSHMLSENSSQGFRESNKWAVELTGGLLPPTFYESFYEGDQIGTLNWWLRTVTGLLFGFGFVWFLFTYFSLQFRAIRLKVEPKLRKVGVIK